MTVLSESTLPVMTFDNGQLKDLLVKGGQFVIQEGGSLDSSSISFTTRLENSSSFELWFDLIFQNYTDIRNLKRRD